MRSKYSHFQEHLEWEILEPDQVISNLTFETGLYHLSKNCIIKFTRDNQYKLVAQISGVVDASDQLEPNIDKRGGTFFPDETVTGYSTDGFFKYKFSGVVLGTTTSSLVSADSLSVKFQADFIFHSVEKYYPDAETEIEFLQEWFLSGKINIHFPRSTNRSVDKAFKKLRDGINPEEDFKLVQSQGRSRDHLFVEYDDISFIVAKVPNGFGPDWSFNISIEYRNSFGRIPDETERKAISELVSFVLGNQLLKVGQTSYSNSASVILQEYQNPWGDNVVSRCKKQAFPPVVIDNYYDWGRAEILLNELLPTFLKQRTQLGFNDALWKYWISRYSSLGINLPILSSAVETLAQQMLKMHPEVKHYYIEYNEFSTIIKDELGSIEKKLEGNPNKGIILNKLKNSSLRGSNEKLDMMFEMINLDVGKIERSAIKARNKMAHSSLGNIGEDEIRETIRMTRAYETLFNRILLKILGYNGPYIDYYTLGHPSRSIDEPIPES
ncbi:MAG: hypothetical protein GXC73_14710 [Chitinophagaceae bacterium]|nr:hypothetical protein [Chitinophagaceae bacterium]